MAYDEDLAERVRWLLAGEAAAEQKMFGGLAFLVGGYMSVAASGQGGLLVRVEPAHMEILLAEPGAMEFEMGRRGPMRGWLMVTGDAVADDETLGVWVSRGLAYARSLPAK